MLGCSLRRPPAGERGTPPPFLFSSIASSLKVLFLSPKKSMPHHSEQETTVAPNIPERPPCPFLPILGTVLVLAAGSVPLTSPRGLLPIADIISIMGTDREPLCSRI